MTISRAGFVKVCGLALFGAGLDASSLEAFSIASPTVDRARPFRVLDATASLFRRQLDTAFDLCSADGASARLVLAEVNERPVTRNVEQFSVIFHAPPDCAIPDGIHTLHHASLGRFELFIVPVGASRARRTVYQACFSRAANTSSRT